MCGVGIYDGDAAASSVSPAGKVAALQARLDASIPTNLRADWTLFIEALNAQASVRAAAMARARDSLRAAEMTLDPNKQASASAD